MNEDGFFFEIGGLPEKNLFCILYATSMIPHWYLGFRGGKEDPKRRNRGASGEKAATVPRFGDARHKLWKTPAHF
jgi:hypothetical protein